MKRWITRDLKGSGNGVVEAQSWHLIGGTERKHGNP
jgi:hypothetical protein